MVTTKASKPKPKKAAHQRKSQTVGDSIIEGLQQAIAWTRGENDNVRVTLVHVPEVDIRAVRSKMRLTQAQFAAKSVSRQLRYAPGNRAGPGRMLRHACCWRSSPSTRRPWRMC